MAEAAVQLKLAGQTYHVVTSANEDELSRLALRVEETLESVTAPGRQPSQQALVLAAITLAHELEDERSKRAALEERHRRMLTSMMTRIDDAMDGPVEQAGNDIPASSSTTIADDETVPVHIVPRRTRGKTQQEGR